MFQAEGISTKRQLRLAREIGGQQSGSSQAWATEARWRGLHSQSSLGPPKAGEKKRGTAGVPGMGPSRPAPTPPLSRD